MAHVLPVLVLLLYSSVPVCSADQKTIRGTEPFHSDEERLYNALLRGYNPYIRPVRRTTDTVNVQLTFSLMQIHSLDEKAQVFTTNGWMIVQWRDERLSWDPARFGNSTEFIVDSTHLWTPELALINGVDTQFPDFSKYRATLSHKGDVRWEPAGVFETSCKIDVTYYPYDNQTCELVFGTWTYTSYKLNLTNSTAFMIQDDYHTNGEWDILSAVMKRTEFVYECCEEIRFSKVLAVISLQRKHIFYTMNVILPCLMLSVLVLVTFLSPPDQGEKISLGISILLSFSVFMLTLSQNMPKTSETIPVFGAGVYTATIMCMNTLSVMLTVLVLNLHHRKSDTEIPGWLRTLFFQILGPIVCIRSTNCGVSSADGRGRYRMVSSKGGKSNNASAFTYNEKMKHEKPRDGQSNTVIYMQKYNRKDTNRNSTPSQQEEPPATPDRTQKPKERETPPNMIYDWKKLAMIVDRLFFWLSLLALTAVTCTVFGILWR